MNRCTVASLVAVVLSVSMISCLPHPLGDSERAKVDPALTGVWMTETEGTGWAAMIMPFDDRAYAVPMSHFEKPADGPEKANSYDVYKGWIVELNGAKFLCLEPLSPRLNPPDNREKTPYLGIRLLEVKADSMLIRPLNGEFEPFKTAGSRQELEKAVIQHLDNEDAYSDKAAKVRRLDVEKDNELIRRLLINTR